MTREKEIANQMHRLLRLAEEALRNCKMVAEDNEWSDTGPMTSGEATIVGIVDRYFGDRLSEQRNVNSYDRIVYDEKDKHPPLSDIIEPQKKT